MVNKKIAAFSLLAFINDNNIGIRTFEDIFIPIVKSSLCRMNEAGYDSGKSTMEIKKHVDSIYHLDIPIPLLKKLLEDIASEFNETGESELTLYQDGSFKMSKFLFADYEEHLADRETEIEEVNVLYKGYLESNGIEVASQPSIFDYIDQSRLTLSKYFAHRENIDPEIEYIHQANFINSIKLNKKIYDILRRIYLGSIISAYLEVDIGKTTSKVELLLDTNFIIGILDLNSEESTHTCRKILEICNRLNYIPSILPFTIEEVEMLIERKSNQLESAFFQGYLDPESIYNAAKRRGLTKTQLQQISNNLRTILETEYSVKIIANDQRYRNLAKYQYSDVYEFYKKLRGTNGFSALHDTTAIAYVKEKRGGQPIKGSITKANCWFVTNTPYNVATPATNGFLPDIIRAEEILNYLWLSNPNVTELVTGSELSSLGLTRLVSSTISFSLPSPKVLKSLDDNFNKYGGVEITADDTVMIATMIAKKKIAEPDDLNRLANQNSKSFIDSVKEYANEGRQQEKEIQEKLVRVLNTFENIVKLKQEEKSEKENSNEELIQAQDRLESLTEVNLSLKRKILKIVVAFGYLTLAALWWSFETVLKLDFYNTINNYLLIKILGQLLFTTLTFAIFTKTYRPAWITGSIALLIALLVTFKK